ncbi:MAG: alpha-ribazole phosphatase [Desulfobacca sp.]|nr:alpha-ribazole phosphatase [Desulfobacca sp.]
MNESKKPTRLFLVRHGEVVRHGQKTFLGFTDLGLSNRGKRQIQALAEYLKGVSLDQAYASDLIRAMDSARSICQGRSIQPLALPGFREMNMGDWDGKSWAEIKQKHPELSPFFFYNLKTFRFPGGETWTQFRSRVLGKLKNVLKDNQGKTILLAAHAGVNRIILAQAMGLRFRNMFQLDQGYACLNIIEYYGDFSRVTLMNGIYYQSGG